MGKIKSNGLPVHVDLGLILSEMAFACGNLGVIVRVDWPYR